MRLWNYSQQAGEKIIASVTVDERDTDRAENSFIEHGGTMINGPPMKGHTRIESKSGDLLG
jgi:hypothetical protein